MSRWASCLLPAWRCSSVYYLLASCGSGFAPAGGFHGPAQCGHCSHLLKCPSMYRHYSSIQSNIFGWWPLRITMHGYSGWSLVNDCMVESCMFSFITQHQVDSSRIVTSAKCQGALCILWWTKEGSCLQVLHDEATRLLLLYPLQGISLGSPFLIRWWWHHCHVTSCWGSTHFRWVIQSEAFPHQHTLAPVF